MTPEQLAEKLVRVEQDGERYHVMMGDCIMYGRNDRDEAENICGNMRRQIADAVAERDRLHAREKQE